jgi:hypothetical protein
MLVDVRFPIRRDAEDPIAATYRARWMFRHETIANGFFAEVPIRAAFASAKVIAVVLACATIPLPELVAA